MGSCITPLCSQPGRVVLTASRLYFQPFNVVSNNPIQTFQMDQASHRLLLPALSFCCFLCGSCGRKVWSYIGEVNDMLGLWERKAEAEFIRISSHECCVQIKTVMKRTYQLIPTGLEVFFKGRNSLYLTFQSTEERDKWVPSRAQLLRPVLCNPAIALWLPQLTATEDALFHLLVRRLWEWTSCHV